MKQNLATWKSLRLAVTAFVVCTLTIEGTSFADELGSEEPGLIGATPDGIVSEGGVYAGAPTYGGPVDGGPIYSSSVYSGSDYPGGAYLGSGYAASACQPWEYGNPVMFYNFYQPNNCGGVPAQLYVAPLPVPQMVGHVYYTYQPLMPHEFLYPHKRTYRKYYNDGRGITRTKVTWGYNPVVVGLQNARNLVRLPR